MITENSRRSDIYAVIRAGGKQYRVEREQLLDVDLMEGDVGSTVELKEVLLVANNGDVSVGTPTVDGAVVEAEIIEHGKGPKLHIFKYKNKTRYRRRMGHRTQYTRLEVKRILQDGKEAAPDEEKPKKRASKQTTEKAKEATATTEAQVEATSEASTEAEAKPKRTPRKTSPKSVATETEVEASVEARTSEPMIEAKEETKKPAQKGTTPVKAQEAAGSEDATEDKGADE